MDVRKIEKLKGLVDCCKQNPSLLHTPPLAFFKNFLESLGARIPTSGESASHPLICCCINGTCMEELKGLMDYCKQIPSLFQAPRLAFFKNFLQSLGAQIPTSGISDAEAASAFKDGEVIPIHSLSELIVKLNAASKASRLSIVYFASAFHSPCRFVTPDFKSLAAKHPKIVFMMVDFDQARDVVAAWEVRHVPIFYFVKNGMTVEWLVTVVVDCLELLIAQHDRF